MNNLQVFNNELFGEVRFMEVDGKPYAVANDVANILGYKNPTDAVRTKCVNIVKYEVENSRGQMRMTNIIPEGDIYRLIIGSKLPQAEKFERWVFDEVLPQIRQTGGYIPVTQEDDDITIMAKALMIAQKTIESKDKLIEQMKPKADKFDNFISTDGTFGFKDLVKYLNEVLNKTIKETEVREFLVKKKIIYKQGRKYVISQDGVREGYGVMRDNIVHDINRPITRYTDKLRDLLLEEFSKGE